MLRVYPGNKEFKIFLGAFAGSVVLYAAGFWLLPADLGFIPPVWQESSPAVDLGNGLLILVLVFHGYWCFAYFSCLSPSMSVMVELRQRGSEGMTGWEALATRGSGEPVNLIFRRRLPKLLKGGYVTEEDGAYRLLHPGGGGAGAGRS